MSNTVLLVLAVLCFASVAVEAKRNRILSLEDAVPVLKKPIIMTNAQENPEVGAAVTKIAEILSREPLAANVKPATDDDDDPSDMAPTAPKVSVADIDQKDIDAEIEKENRVALGVDSTKTGANKRFASKDGDKKSDGKGGKDHKDGKKGSDSKGGDSDDDGEEEDSEKAEIMKEIAMLERLIAEGKRIQQALPEKEARLNDLRAKLLQAAAGKSKQQAKRKLAEQQKLLDEVNDKIEALQSKLAELNRRKAQIEAVIAKYKSQVGGGGSAPSAPGAPAAPAAPPKKPAYLYY